MTDELTTKNNTVNNGLTEALGLEVDHFGNIKDSTVLSKLFNSNAQMLLTYDWVALTNAYKNLHEKQIIPNIKKGLSATVYTQVSDVEFEVNGILSYDRELVKLDEDVLRELNSKMTY